MSSDSRSDDEYGRRVQALLSDAVQNELIIAAGIEGVDLSPETIERFAQALVSRLDYAFRFRWDPSWAKGGPHEWAEGDAHYTRCTSCLAVSPPSVTPEAAYAWYREHASAADCG